MNGRLLGRDERQGELFQLVSLSPREEPCGSHRPPHGPGFLLCFLECCLMASYWNHMRVSMVLVINVHHGSYELLPRILIEGPIEGWNRALSRVAALLGLLSKAFHVLCSYQKC